MAKQAQPFEFACVGSAYGCRELAAPGEKLCGECKAHYSNWAWREFMRLGGAPNAGEVEIRAWGVKVGLAKLWRQYVDWRQNGGIEKLLAANSDRVRAEKSRKTTDA